MTDELIEPSNPDLWDSPETVQAYVGALEDEIDRLRELESICQRLLYHDERGQGIGWQEAMRDLAAAIRVKASPRPSSAQSQP
jgi:hypothetical protein